MTPAARTRALSFHARYACGRTGACCTSGWPIGVEPEVARAVRVAIRAGRLSATPFPPFAPAAAPGGPELLATDARGRCVFFRPGPPRACAVHSALGHNALPVSCRQFPRVSLLGPDAVRVSLSHYCPTAAGLLFEDGPLAVVEDPPAFPAAAAYEGLDARGSFGPLLRPGVLLGWDVHALWEAHAVSTFARAESADQALAGLAQDVTLLRRWTAGDGALAGYARDVFARRPDAGGFPMALPDAVARRDDAVAAVAPLAPAPAPLPAALAAADALFVAPAWPALSLPLRRYLAARAFGSWAAVQGAGLRTALRALEVALAVVRVEAARLCASASAPLDARLLLESFRAADLLLLHLASPETLARRLSRSEERG